MISEHHFYNWLISSITMLAFVLLFSLLGEIPAMQAVGVIISFPLVEYVLLFLLEKMQGRKRRDR